METPPFAGRKDISKPRLISRSNDTIVSFYAVGGSAWFLWTDRISDPVAESFWSLHLMTVWVVLFILVTAILLSRLLYRYAARLAGAEEDKRRAYDATVNSWAELLSVRHQETEGHSIRVTGVATNFARLLGTRGEELDDIRRGALLHDIGKLAIPDQILNKPGSLNDEEWKIIKRHPESASKMLFNIPYVTGACRDIPIYHHERWDGSGYPYGLRGLEIPWSARLFSIVDVWESMTHTRAYKPALDEAVVLDYIQNNAGTQFDPDLAGFFVNHYKEITAAGISGNISNRDHSTIQHRR